MTYETLIALYGGLAVSRALKALGYKDGPPLPGPALDACVAALAAHLAS